MIFAGGLLLLILASIQMSQLSLDPYHSDLTAFATGWHMVLAGVGDQLYDFGRQTQIQTLLRGGTAVEVGLLPFVHPPHTALLLAPLGWLGGTLRFLVWLALQGLALAGLVSWLPALAGRDGPAPRGWTLLALCASAPVAICLQRGQLSFALACALAVFCLTLPALDPPDTTGGDSGDAGSPAGHNGPPGAGRDRPLAARRAAFHCGLALALLALKPQLALFPGLLLLLRAHQPGARRALTLGVGLTLALSLLASLVLGPASWIDWLQAARTLATRFGEMGIRPELMASLKGWLAAGLGYGQAALINRLAALGALLGLAAGALFVWRRRDPGALAAALALQLALAPHLYLYDLVLIAVPLGLLVQTRRRWVWLALGLVPALTLAAAFVGGSAGLRLPGLAAVVVVGLGLRGEEG